MKRRDLLRWAGAALVAAPVLDWGEAGTALAGADAASDDALLEEIERTAFRFFWEQASPKTGQVKDRAGAGGVDKYRASSIAATGFGLTGLCLADRRRWAPARALRERVHVTLRFIADTLPHVHGFFYHFVDMESGQRMWKDVELSSIDTALLLCGVLTCRGHYAADRDIVALATRIYERVDWPWMLDGGTTLSMGWKPESGFLQARWDQYCEHMMLYLLGVASPTHPLPASSWKAWRRPVVEYFGLKYISGTPALFTHQYSQAWFDFRGRRDDYADYFQNSVRATRAHRAFCLSLKDRFPDYGDDLWGISASDSAHGYVAWGGPPAEGPIDGTVVPYAAGGSLPFLPAEALRVLRTMRTKFGDRAWGRYGFVDAFNPRTGWVNPDILGIDQGIMMIMVENHRTGFVWETFMRDKGIRSAMERVGFRATQA